MTFTSQAGELGGYLLGRRLYEAMLVWETDTPLRDTEARSAFADVWCALPLDLIETRTFGSRVVFERYGRTRGQPD